MVLASLASLLAESGASFALATDRLVRGFPSVLPFGRGSEHLGMVLELLARCEPGRGMAIMPLLAGAGAAGAGYALVSRSAGEAGKKSLGLPTARRDRLIFILADGAGKEELGSYPVLSFEELLKASGAER